MKTIAVNLKPLKYLFWLGPMLVLAGLSAGIVSATWGAIPIGLVIAGVVVIGLWLLYQTIEPSQQSAGFWRRRSTQVSTNAIIATLAVIAILGLVNFLGVRYVQRLDLTENQIFTLAPESQQLVRNLKQPIKVWAFDPQQNPEDRELLESYRRQGNQFSFEFINPNAQPTLAQQFEVKKLGDVVVESASANRRQFVQNVNEQNRLSEAKLTNAIEQVTSDRPSQIYMLQGHGERAIEPGQGAISQAIKSLKDKNGVVKPLNLIETKFPADADVVVVAGPQKALLEPEVKALDTYLKQGGGLLVMTDPNTDAGLDSLLSSWGVILDKRVVIDASGTLAELGPAYSSVTQYGDHPITKDFGNTLSYYPLARPVDVKPISGVQATPLLYTNDRTWAESNIKAQPLKFDPQVDRRGPLVIGAALSRSATPEQPQPLPSPNPAPSPNTSPKSSSASPTPQTSPSPAPTPPSPQASPTSEPAKPAKQSRLVMLGNSSFAADGLFDRVANGDVFLNSVRWLSQQDDQALSLRPKEVKNRRITLTSQQANLASWTALGILPLIGFGAAFAVWWRRR